MDVYLTDVGKAWLQDHYPQGIPYRIPPDVDGKPTIRKKSANTC